MSGSLSFILVQDNIINCVGKFYSKTNGVKHFTLAKVFLCYGFVEEVVVIIIILG